MMTLLISWQNVATLWAYVGVWPVERFKSCCQIPGPLIFLWPRYSLAGCLEFKATCAYLLRQHSELVLTKRATGCTLTVVKYFNISWRRDSICCLLGPEACTALLLARPWCVRVIRVSRAWWRWPITIGLPVRTLSQARLSVHGTLVRATHIHLRQSLRSVWCGFLYEYFSWRRWKTEANCFAFPRPVSRTSWFQLGLPDCQIFNPVNVESTTAMDLALVLQEHHTVLDDHQPPSYNGSSSRVEFKADVQQNMHPPTSSSMHFGTEDGKILG